MIPIRKDPQKKRLPSAELMFDPLELQEWLIHPEIDIRLARGKKSIESVRWQGLIKLLTLREDDVSLLYFSEDSSSSNSYSESGSSSTFSSDDGAQSSPESPTRTDLQEQLNK